ncbi:MAG: fimbrillin family protein [Bacteroidetes bacterium]|nr:fimbrillin family protein [Bacteroidota bacterium]
MKKTLLFAIVVAMTTFSGCSKNEIVDTNRKTNEINFNAYTDSPTKAEIIDTKSFSDFNMYGYITTEEYLGTSDLGIEYINNLHLIKDDATKSWTHTDKYFWPINNEKLHFFAVSPANSLIYNYQTSVDSYPSFDYTIGNIGNTQKDFVVSSLLNQEQSINNGSANFNFKHSLSQICFSLKGEVNDFEYTVTSVKLINIKNKGTFTFNGTDKIGSWSNQSGSETYTHDLTDFVVDGTNPTPLAKENTMILMPQEDSENSKIEITYSVRQKLSGVEIFNGSKEVNLPSLNWAKNSNIRYILTLPVNGKKMTFSADVNIWDKNINKDISILKINKTELSILQTGTETLTAELKTKEPESSYKWSSDNSSIPDAIFKQKLISLITNITNENEVSIPEALSIEEIEFNYCKIKSLEGIKYFKNLRELDCSDNLLTSLNVNNNPKLEELDCSYNKLTSLNIGDANYLRNIDCSNNLLNSINVDYNISLNELNCSSNNLKSIDVTYASLTKLECQNNNITSINFNKYLSELDCSDNELTSINFTDKEYLCELNCSGNDLESIIINDNLYGLNCSYNQLTSIDISNNTDLQNLNCSNNHKITSLDLRNNIKLEYLDCTNCEDLKEIYVRSDFDINNYPYFYKDRTTIYVKE